MGYGNGIVDWAEHQKRTTYDNSDRYIAEINRLRDELEEAKKAARAWKVNSKAWQNTTRQVIANHARSVTREQVLDMFNANERHVQAQIEEEEGIRQR